MVHKLTMLSWRGESFWLGRLVEYPEIMTQGASLAELEENMKDAYRLMTSEEGGDGEIALGVVLRDGPPAEPW